MYLNTVLTKVFAIVFVFGKFMVFAFVFKYCAMYLDPSLLDIHVSIVIESSSGGGLESWLVFVFVIHFRSPGPWGPQHGVRVVI